MVQRVRLLLLMLCAAPVAMHATVLVPAEFREIVNGADIIAYGRVIDTTVEWGDDRKRVETLVTLQVGTYLKGGPGDTIVFRVPGGQIGRFRNVMVGAPQFVVGEETIVFLNTQGAERPHVFGLNQGVFRVRHDEQTKRRVVTPPALSARGSAPEKIVRGAAGRRPVPLETFGAQVQTVMAESATRTAR
jgi:hypothetical protein